MQISNSTLAALLLTLTSTLASAAPVYLNDANIAVALGPTMPAQPFVNRSAADSLASIIDAPSASAPEFHNQGTHVWSGRLEVVFDFGVEYDLSFLHFWNYHGEGYDVDNIDFNFYDASMGFVGNLLNVSPALGNNTGSDATEILAETLALSFPSRVRYVNAVLTGSNGEVDFNNLGFTGEASSVPEPASVALTLLGASTLFAVRAWRKAKV